MWCRSIQTSSRLSRSTGSAAAALLLALAASGVLLTMSACNIVAPAAYVLEGPPKKPARYLIPSGKVVVVVDDPDNRLSRVVLRTRIGDMIADTLIKEEVVPSAISTKDAVAWVRKHDRPGSMSSLEEVGKAVGADIVIGVKMIAFNLSVDGVQPKPLAVAEVRGVDLRNGTVLFPEGAGWEPVETTMKEVQPELYRTSVGRREIEDSTADSLAEQIAWLFYEHEIVPLGKGVRGQARR